MTQEERGSSGTKPLQAMDKLRRELIGGLVHAHGQANANTSRILEATTFLYALIELLAEKGVLTVEELDARKDSIADRVERRFLKQGMGVVLQEPDQDKYALQSEAQSTVRIACIFARQLAAGCCSRRRGRTSRRG
jgi:hypothetical protein